MSIRPQIPTGTQERELLKSRMKDAGRIGELNEFLADCAAKGHNAESSWLRAWEQFGSQIVKTDEPSAPEIQLEARKRVRRGKGRMEAPPTEAEVALLEQGKKDRQYVKEQSRPATSSLPLQVRAAFAGDGIPDKVDPRKALMWVYENLWVADVRPAEAPSPGTWGYMMYLRENEDAKFKFYTDTWPKMLPTKSQMEDEDARRDDGKAISSLERIIQAKQLSLLSSSAKGTAGQPALPQEPPAPSERRQDLSA